MLVRTATEQDSAALAALHVAVWRESYAELVPASLLASLSVEDRQSTWRRILSGHGGAAETEVFLVEADRRLVGFASCGRQRTQSLHLQGFDGEISALYVLKPFQNQGLGRRLMAAAGESLQQRGFKAAALWVLKDNHEARRFYEQLGARQVGSRNDHRGEHVLVEVAYGWPDLEHAAPGAGTPRDAHPLMRWS